MTFRVISVMGRCVEQSLLHGVVGRSFEKGLHGLEIINPRDFTKDTHQTTDDRPFGGGDGMLMMAEPLQQSLDSIGPLDPEANPVFLLSPQGRLWSDSMASEVSEKASATFICGRYAGIDERFRILNGIQEVSIGDYVLSGGELACAVMVDSIARKVPQVLGHQNSALLDSLGPDGLLEAPQYTRPREWRNLVVPETLLQGDHKKIEAFRGKLAWLVTLQKRPELIRQKPPKGLKLHEFLDGLKEDDLRCLGLDKACLLTEMQRREW